MKSFALSFLVVATASLPGCLTLSGIVKTRAANDFGCPEDDVTVVRIAGTSYRANGCDESAIYNCYGASCIPEAPPPATPPAAAPPPTAPKGAPAPAS
jgi:hypothetical protein